MDFGTNLSYGIGTSYTAENYTDEAIYSSPKVVYNSSIDSITPQQWNTMNQKHLNETKETK
jgi:hypothetical protein